MSKIRKAIVAGVGAALSAVGTVITTGQHMSWGVVASAVVAGVIFGYGVWQTPNKTQ